MPRVTKMYVIHCRDFENEFVSPPPKIGGGDINFHQSDRFWVRSKALGELYNFNSDGIPFFSKFIELRYVKGANYANFISPPLSQGGDTFKILEIQNASNPTVSTMQNSHLCRTVA